MSTTIYHPKLSSLIDASAIPGDLKALEQSLQEGINALLGELRYTNYIVEHSADNDASFHRLTILSKELKLDLFSDMTLFFFKGQTDGYSEFLVSLDWRWPVLKYINSFELEGFAYLPESFLDILLQLAGIDDVESVARQMVKVFFDDDLATFMNSVDALKAILHEKIADDEKVELIIQQIDEIVSAIRSLIESGELAISTIFGNEYSSDGGSDEGGDPSEENNTGELPGTTGELHGKVSALALSLREVMDEADLIRILITAALSALEKADEKFDRLFKLFDHWLTDISKENIEKLLIPSFEIALTDINMALEFPRDWVLPMVETEEGNGIWIVDTNVNNKASINYSAGSVKYSTENGFQIAVTNTFDVPRMMIPGLGLQLKVKNIKLDISRTENISEAIEDDRPEDFMGAYIEETDIFLPEDWFKFDEHGSTLALFAKDVLVGSGGVSGIFGLASKSGNEIGSDDRLSYKFGKKDSGYDWELGFNSFDLKLVQNNVTESNIKGFLTIPKLKQYEPATKQYLEKELKINTTLFFESDGNFSISASSEEGLCLGVKDVFYVKIDSLSVGRDESKAYLEVSGDLHFEECDLLKDIIEKPIEIKKLRIYSDGSYEIEGGSIPLPGSVTMSLGPTEISITHLTLGSEDVNNEPYKFIGFDCGLSMGSAGLDLRGDGIKLMFNADGSNIYLKIEGIGVDLIIPSGVDEKDAVVIIKGYLSMREEEYIGSVSFSLPKVGLAGGAAMKMRPKVPAFVIDSFLSLPVAIPLGPTGLGIFSFRGLFGLGYEPNLPEGALEDNQLFFDFYKEKVKNPLNGGALANGLHIGKMREPEDDGLHNDTFVVGAGLTMATMADKEAFSMEAFLFLAVPQFLMISGRANILGEMVTPLSEKDVPFFGYLKITDESLALGLSADFKLDKVEGSYLQMEAEADLKFPFKNPSAWYVHLGTKEKPNTAAIIRKIFKLDAEAYLMLSGQGISTGATVKFDFKRTYGPVKVSANAFVEAFLEMNFKHFQVGGGIAVGGGASVTFCGIGFSISVGAYLMATLPKPFMIKGGVHACVKISFFFFDLKACFTVSFDWMFEPGVNREAIGVIDRAAFALTADQKEPSGFVAAYHIGSNKTYPIRKINIQCQKDVSALPDIKDLTFNIEDFDCIPLDSYIDISLNKSVDPSEVKNIANGVLPVENNREFVPPGEGIELQVKHLFYVKNVNVKILSKDGWKEYHPYKALGSDAYKDPLIKNEDLKIGSWQLAGKEHNKLRLLSTNPFGFMNHSNDRPEDFDITPIYLFCSKKTREWHCEEWKTSQLFELNKWKKYKELFIKPSVKNVTVEKYSNIFNIDSSIKIDKTGKLELIFPKSVKKCKLKLFSATGSVLITFLKRVDRISNEDLINQEYVVIEQKGVSFTNTSKEVEYTKDDAVDRVTIELSQVVLSSFEKIEKLKKLNEEIQLALGKGLNTLPDGTPVDQTTIDKNKTEITYWINKLSLNCLKNDKVEALQKEIDALKQSFIDKKCDALNENHPNLNVCKSIIKDLGKKEAEIEELKEKGFCNTYLHQVCWLTEEDYNFNLTLQNNQDHGNENAMFSASKIIAPIWRPGEAYCIELETEEIINDLHKHEKFFIPFRTEGPLGHFSLKNLTKEVKEQYSLNELGVYVPEELDELGNYVPKENANEKFETSSINIPELTLKSYINYNISYPNPNGNILNSKPLYYEKPLLQIFFTQSYVYHMFNTWPSYQGLDEKTCSLEIVVKDPSDNSDINPERKLLVRKPETKTSWQINLNPMISSEYGLLDNLLQNAECVSIKQIEPFERYLASEVSNLLPSKLYTAIAVSNYANAKSNIHSYAFQTSRYANFNEHINSYFLKDKTGATTKAAYVIDTKLEDVFILSIFNLLGASVGLYRDKSDLERVTKYPNACERIIREYLNLNNVKIASSSDPSNVDESSNPILPPSGLDFNFLVDPDNHFIGTWIRSVEPLNNPTIPIDLLQQTIVPIYEQDDYDDTENRSRTSVKQTDYTNVDDIIGKFVTDDKKYISIFSDDCTQVLVLNMNLTVGLPKEIRFMFKYLIWNNNLEIPGYEIKASEITSNLVEPNN